LWDSATGELLAPPLTGHTSSVSSVVFSPNGQTVASTGDNTVILWDLEQTPPQKTVLYENTEPVRTLAFSPDGSMLASGSNDNTVILWDVATARPIGEPLREHDDWVRSVAFQPRWQNFGLGR
jgi:WD40 repeat protein